MIAQQLQEMQDRAEHMRDSLMGCFMVQALKGNDPVNYELLVCHFLKNPAFIAELDRMNNTVFRERTA